MLGSLMQYMCCDWEVTDKTSYTKPVIHFESTTLLLRKLTRDYYLLVVDDSVLITICLQEACIGLQTGNRRVICSK